MKPTLAELWQELTALFLLVRKLPPNQQEEFLCMLKSAAIIADKCA